MLGPFLAHQEAFSEGKTEVLRLQQCHRPAECCKMTCKMRLYQLLKWKVQPLWKYLMLFQQSRSLKLWAQAKDHIQEVGSATRIEFHFPGIEVLGVPGLIREPLFWIRGIKGTGLGQRVGSSFLRPSRFPTEGGVYSLKAGKAKISPSAQLRGTECPRKQGLMGACNHIRILRVTTRNLYFKSK